jgi:hypothetical protein
MLATDCSPKHPLLNCELDELLLVEIEQVSSCERDIFVAVGAWCSNCGPEPEHETEALSPEPVFVLSSRVTVESFKRTCILSQGREPVGEEKTKQIYKMGAYGSIKRNGSLCLVNHS